MTYLRDIARSIFDRALADCSVEPAVARFVSVREHALQVGDETIALSRVRRIRIVAVGKAARPMLVSLLRQLPADSQRELAGVLIAPEESTSVTQLRSGIQLFAGGHPSPNEASFAGARAALTLLRELPQDSAENSLVFFLISGGASAMMELPLDPTISLADTASFHRSLVGSGASITEINCVRKHFSAVKGGRLAIAAGAAMCQSLLLSDVPVGREDALGSGPTVPDSSTVEECRAILEKYRLLAQFPPAVRNFFQSSALVETPKPQELKARATVLLSAQSLAEAAARHARALGYFPTIDNSCDDWDYKAAAIYLLDRLRDLRTRQSRACLISVGEVLVTLPSQPDSGERVGIGGRNQQFALYSATLLRPQDEPIAILSAGSDGIDGNSPAAGAVVDGETVAGTAGPEAMSVLEHFDSYTFLGSRAGVIVTGASGNNLRDLRVLLAGDPQTTNF